EGRGEALTPSPSPEGRGEALTPSPSPEGRGETLTPSPSPEGRGVLYGRGAVDAKGPLACFTDAVARVGAVEGWQFVVIGAVEEERDSDGARFLVDKYRPDFLIVGEPNRWDRIALGYKGSAWAEITVRRVQSHTASGEQTAAEAAVEAWLAIRAFAESFNAEKQRAFDKILPTLRNIEAGQDGFAQWARLSVGVRLPVEMPPEQWYARLREIVSDAEMQPVGYAVPAWGCEKNTPLVRALLSGIRSQGGSPSFVYKTGTADLNIVAPVWQCPAVVYGPGDSALDHTPHEHISLEEYEKAVEVLAAALMNLVENQSKP
ncbi:MAG: M20/M25/M40 family metallo-hydrolase, partial [Anaerolineales bacterium]|nr:M20/M25/M40 family metallo-hydrolase [Anaerolineales bacterium]